MKTTLFKTLSILLAAVLLLPLGGCGKKTPELSQEITIGGEEPAVQSIGQALEAAYAADQVFSLNAILSDSFNPYQTTSAWNQVVGMLVYETLVVLDESFEAQPNLVSAWQTEDGIHWRFSVDSSRKFHGGGDMTAWDAVYSIRIAMTGKYAERLSHIEGVSALDRESFEVTLDEANFLFYRLLNIPCIEADTSYMTMPPGNGPYQFSAAGTYLSLDENHPLASEMPIDTIYLKEYSAAEDILQAFEDSLIDLVINDPNGMASLGYASTNIIKYVDTTCMHYLGYNMKSPVFGSPIYRALMTYAIDRDTIVSDIMAGAGVAATLPLHPDSAQYPTIYAEELEYSEAAFKNALGNVGIADLDGDGQMEIGGGRYTINFIVCSDSAVKVSAAREIADKLREAGFGVYLRELSYEDYITNLEEGTYDIYYGEVKLCADWDLSLFFEEESPLNPGGYTDYVLMGHIKTYLGSGTEMRESNTGVLYQYIGQNAPITVICFEKSEALYHRGVLAGLSPTQDNLFTGMENWTINLS